MGYGYSSLNVTLSLWQDGLFKGFRSVVEIGAQDIKGYPPEVDLAVSQLVGKQVQTRDPKSAKTAYSAKRMYEALGFDDYQCIDANGNNGAHVFDLNEDLRAKGFKGQFDLVTNHGTTEHCFNQYSCFKNIHDICKVGGIMHHDVPFQGYLNHGLFNYQPNFFLCLARANDYQVVGMYVNLDSDLPDISTYSEALMKWITLPGNATVTIIAILKKTSDKEFRSAWDEKYIGESAFKNGYGFQNPVKTHLPVGINEIGYAIPARTLTRILANRLRMRLMRTLRLG